MPEHRDIPASESHEPKGADIAPAGSVYVFDGAGSGSPQVLETPEPQRTVTELEAIILNAIMTNTDIQDAIAGI